MDKFFKSVVEQDTAPVVICNTEHIVVYMNRSAVLKYAKKGGSSLIGRSLLDCHNDSSKAIILKVVKWFSEKKENNIVFTYRNEKENKDVYMVALRDENGNLIGYYEKHEYRDREKTEPYNFLLD